jgi:multimeric flavodoxin WrbA
MKVMVINGSPSPRGVSAMLAERVSELLSARGMEVDPLRLAEMRIEDCKGCLKCLSSGICSLHDDMSGIIERMRVADGFVVISSVRNGSVTACYKRFYERITYTLGFPLELENKQTLAIATVGMAGGRAVNRKFLGLQDVMQTRLSGFLFFRSGALSKERGLPECDRRLLPAIDRFVGDVAARRRKSPLNRCENALDRWVVKKFMLQKNPDFYANVLRHWQNKEIIKN